MTQSSHKRYINGLVIEVFFRPFQRINLSRYDPAVADMRQRESVVPQVDAE